MKHDLTRDEQQLAEFMSKISERCYCAGWIENTEYALWDAMISGPKVFGQDAITQQDIDKLIELSRKTKSWIVFDDEREEIAVSLEIWKKRFAERNFQ